MRAKIFAVLIAGCVLCAVSYAQEYFIRSNRGLNLRTAPSLNADIAETVASGELLQVVSKFNRWLKIDRSGREVWLAEWVDYSRVDSNEPTGSQQPTSQVDNCCYVDRQCNTDLEWVVGWHAYRNNQCGASAQQQPQTSAAPVGNVPANVDNCCHVNRQCATEQDWTNGWAAYKFLQCRSDIPIPIEGSQAFINWMSGFLNQLRNEAPQWYHYVITGLRNIREASTGSGKSGVYAYPETGTANYLTSLMWELTSAEAMEFIPSSLVHEACHVHQIGRAHV